MSAYELLEKSELGGIIEALQRMISQQTDRIAELEKESQNLETALKNALTFIDNTKKTSKE